DPRHVLKRTLSKTAEAGFSFYTQPEIEFILLKDRPSDGSEPQPVDTGGYFDMTSHDTAHDFRRMAVGALEELGISVEFSHHEVAPGQQEIDLRYADALTTADNIMTFRHVVKEVAMAQGAHATFMPKPFTLQPGSGMHTHLSLFEGDRNAFHDPTDELNLSKTARSFIAGLLVHAREITEVTNQRVNSYKRLFGWADRASSTRRRPLSAGAMPTARPWCGCRGTSPARPTPRGSRFVRRIPPATPTSRSPCCSRPA
ncbi:MAG: glutamine synthetase, type i, partial [Jatrophihabitantaceae bacterium]|nr:glutamine synthetase, type i [Jatrophihabitantaceae bacterium]